MREECDIIRTCIENAQATEEVLNRFGWKETSWGKWEFMGTEEKPAVDGRAMAGSTCRNQSRGSGSLYPREGKPPPEQCNALEGLLCV